MRPRRQRRLSGLAGLLFLLAVLSATGCLGTVCLPDAQGLPPLQPWSGRWRSVLPEDAYSPGHGIVVSGEAAVLRGRPGVPAVLESVNLGDLPPGRYGLEFQVLRKSFTNGSYLTLELMGERIWLDNHCVVGGWQDMRLEAVLAPGARPRIAFVEDQGEPFAVRRPVLMRLPEPPPSAAARPAPAPVFPLGAFEVPPGDLAEVKACGFDTVYMNVKGDRTAPALKRAAELGVRVLLNGPRDIKSAERLAGSLAALPPEVRPAYIYLVDEPSIRSFPPEKLQALRREYLARLPETRFVTSMVRPWMIPAYTDVYDALLMDQYPVPNQPLSWLADSMDQARALARPGTAIWGVVQAFGGGQFVKMGWSRKPTSQEMAALAASALTAGARGLMFYSWRFLGDAPGFKVELCRLVRRLDGLRNRFPLNPGLPPGFGQRSLWRVKADVGGGPAVRFGWSRQGGRLLIVAVNQTPHAARWLLESPEKWNVRLEELWRGGEQWVYHGQLMVGLPPLAVRAWLWPSPEAE